MLVSPLFEYSSDFHNLYVLNIYSRVAYKIRLLKVFFFFFSNTHFENKNCFVISETMCAILISVFCAHDFRYEICFFFSLLCFFFLKNVLNISPDKDTNAFCRQGSRDGRFVLRKIQQLTVEIGSAAIANHQRQPTRRVSSSRNERRSKATARVQHTTERGRSRLLEVIGQLFYRHD